MTLREIWDAFGLQVFLVLASGSLVVAIVQAYRAPRELRLEADRGNLEKRRAEFEIAQLAQVVARDAMESLRVEMASMVDDHAMRMAEQETRFRTEIAAQAHAYGVQLHRALQHIQRMEQAMRDAGVPVPQDEPGWQGLPTHDTKGSE